MNLGSFTILLPFFRTSWGVGVLNSATVNSFHNWVEFGTILEGLQNFGGGGLKHQPPPRYATDVIMNISDSQYDHKMSAYVLLKNQIKLNLLRTNKTG